MRYSVYDYTRRVYDYYDAPGPGGTHAGSPTVMPSLGSFARQWKDSDGVPPSNASWKLPLGAKKIGSGERPVGRIASMGDDDPSSSALRWGIYAAIAYLGWRALR
jgi:hypothetical protein